MISIDDIRWAWAASSSIADTRGLKALKTRIKVVTSAARHADKVAVARHALPGSTLARLINERPAMLGALIWPYQCAAWEAAERMDRIINHCAAVDALGPPFTFGVNERLVLLDLDDVSPGFKIVLDQPQWFMREGGLTINIFIGDFRAYSLAFSFYKEEDSALTAFVGAMQGRDREDILALYRNLTKSLFGVRPRDFLIEAFRMLARRAGVKRILAVRDAYRHHRHAYFNNKEDFTVDYDDIWQDRGGAPASEIAYELSVDGNRRDLADIKPKKRSMYRKRYEFLDEIDARLGRDLPGLQPVWFEDS